MSYLSVRDVELRRDSFYVVCECLVSMASMDGALSINIFHVIH